MLANKLNVDGILEQQQESGAAGPASRQGSGNTDLVLPGSRLFMPQGPAGFAVKIVSGADIVTISKEKLKLNLLETFDRPNPQVQATVAQQLVRLVEANPDGVSETIPCLATILDLLTALKLM